MSGFETETEERCFADVLPAGQTHAIVKYWLALSDDTGLAALQYYTLKVRVNGGTFRTIANHKLVSEIDFLGVTPDCVPSVNSPGEVCLYEKQFETVVDLPGSTGNTPMQIEVVIAVSTSDQSKSEGLILDGSIHYNFRMVIEQVNPLFIPRDASDPAAKCDVAANTGNCYPTISSRMVRRSPLSSESPIGGRIRFRLVFDKPHLTGNSSNNGSQTTPDYEINPGYDPDANGLGSAQELSEFKASGGLQPDGSFMVETIGEDLIGATVKITSRDFGGRARVHSEIVLSDGTVVPADLVVDENNNEVATPACLSQSEFSFATLPLDQDCDEIADAWERSPTDTVAPGVGPIANAEEDAESGPGGPHAGDGYTAHDEYRGFHLIVPDGSTTQTAWARTDPINNKDVFYWNVDGESKLRSGLTSTLYVQHPQLVIHEVNGDQAGDNSVRVLNSRWVNRLAKNSIHSQNLRQAYSIVMKSWPGPQSLPALGFTSEFRIVGVPLYYEAGNIESFVVDKAIPSTTLETLLANRQVLRDYLWSYTGAHEVAHQFGNFHPFRENCGLPSNCSHRSEPAPITLLNFSEFSPNSSSPYGMYLRMQMYVDPRPGTASEPLYSEKVMIQMDPSNKESLFFPSTANVIQDPVDPLHRITGFLVGGTTPVATTAIVRVWRPNGTLMDWAPDFRYMNAVNLKLSTGQLERICVHALCCPNKECIQ